MLSRARDTAKRVLRRLPSVRIARNLERLNTRLARLERSIERLEAMSKRSSGTIERLEATSRRIDARLTHEVKWRSIFNRKLDATLRALYLSDLEALPYPYRLTMQRFKLRSQNEEDGILLALLREAGVTTRKFVDIGSGSTGGNAGLLAYECGWAGLMVDVRSVAVREARWRFAGNAGVIVVRERVTMENVNELVAAHGFVGEVDLFSIDIDSHDYWLLKALAACSPRILVVEYNAHFGPDASVTVPYEALPDDAPKGYHGASLTALERLGREKGYRLVACDNMGANAFFLRDDVGRAVPGLTPREAYRPALSRLSLFDEEARQLNVHDAIRERGLPLVEV